MPKARALRSQWILKKPQTQRMKKLAGTLGSGWIDGQTNIFINIEEINRMNIQGFFELSIGFHSHYTNDENEYHLKPLKHVICQVKNIKNLFNEFLSDPSPIIGYPNSLLVKLTFVVETWLMWHWLLKMPTHVVSVADIDAKDCVDDSWSRFWSWIFGKILKRSFVKTKFWLRLWS